MYVKYQLIKLLFNWYVWIHYDFIYSSPIKDIQQLYYNIYIKDSNVKFNFGEYGKPLANIYSNSNQLITKSTDNVIMIRVSQSEVVVGEELLQGEEKIRRGGKKRGGTKSWWSF